MLVAYSLLDLVEKLHKAEIVHGHLCPEVLFLGDRLVASSEVWINAFNASSTLRFLLPFFCMTCL